MPTTAQLREIFTSYDIDASGFLDVSELQAALFKAGRSASRDKCAALLFELDANHDRLISFDEFAAVFERVPDRLAVGWRVRQLIDASTDLLTGQAVGGLSTSSGTAAVDVPAEWAARLDNLQKRFPDVPRDHVAVVLHTAGGHAGNAVAALRKTGATEQEAATGLVLDASRQDCAAHEAASSGLRFGVGTRVWCHDSDSVIGWTPGVVVAVHYRDIYGRIVPYRIKLDGDDPVRHLVVRRDDDDLIGDDLEELRRRDLERKARKEWPTRLFKLCVIGIFLSFGVMWGSRSQPAGSIESIAFVQIGFLLLAFSYARGLLALWQVFREGPYHPSCPLILVGPVGFSLWFVLVAFAEPLFKVVVRKQDSNLCPLLPNLR